MIVALLALLGHAQQPSEPWRTVETEHFRMHYPLAAEAWSLQAAARLEAMRARVIDQVGNDLDRKVTIVVRDPYATSNGMAIPFIRGPRTELWLTGPSADSVIGWNRRWDEGLIVHEDTHLVHLASRSRGGIDGVLDVLTGVGPIARKAPTWVAEGFATVVEGDQTGFGRPFAATEAAMLRRLATEGRLPSYGELDGTGRWGGRGFPYGVGSAYLRWLRDRTGPESLKHLWLRMRARKFRSFEEAFEGVFGDDPKALYGRFVAETTADAMAWEALHPPREGTRWIDLEEGTWTPAISPDGSKIALVVTQDDRPVLAVFDAEEDKDKAQKAWDRSVAELLRNDPEDIPGKRPPEPSLGEPEIRLRRDRAPSGVRWLGADEVLFSARVPHASGRLRRDLFAWSPEDLTERRITRWQDVHTADPAPDGTWAIAVQQAWGTSCLAHVDLKSGETTCLTEEAADVLYDAPRVHPDGDRILWLEQRNGPWTLMTASVRGGELSSPMPVPVPEGAQLSGPAWHPDGARIVVSMGLTHLLEIGVIDLQSGKVELWTRSSGGATRPAITEDHLYWLNEDAEGLDLHRSAVPGKDGGLEPEPLPAPPDGLPLAVLPPGITVELPATAELEPRRYGLGRLEPRPLLAVQLSKDEARTVAGARLGDMLGRHEAILLGGLHRTGGESAFGGRGSWVLRSLPFDIQTDAWLTQDVQDANAIRLGGGLSIRDTHRWAWGAVRGEAGAFADPGLDGATGRFAGHARLATSLWEPTLRLASFRAEAHTTAGLWGDAPVGAIVGGSGELGLLEVGLVLGARLDTALGGAPDLSLGAMHDPLLPDAWQADRIRVGALPLQSAIGRTHLSVDATLGGTNGGLYIARHGVGDDPLRNAFTLAGVRGSAQVPAQPLVGLPRTVTEFGLACQLQDPVNGTVERACRKLEHWTAWTGVRFRLD